MQENRELRELNISDVLPNRFQPRLKFEQDSLEQLAESISKFGVIEPVVVRPVGNKFEIVAGERRYKASKLASKSTIPAIIINLTDKESEELALLENVQRKALNPIEEAVSYKRILDAGYITREDLAKKIGKPQTEILNKIRLLKLSDEVQSYLLSNKISERHARSLLKISDLDEQTKMLHRIVNERLTVKQTDREIRKMSENGTVEVLSINERGNENMDIDKIMREAQDINSPESQNNNMPDLMAAGNAPVSEPIVAPEPAPAPINNEESKFISPMAEPVVEPAAPEPVVNNFDAMVNSPLSEPAFVPNVPLEAPTVDPVMPVESAPTPEVNQQDISEAVASAFNNSNNGLNIADNSKFINVPDTDILQDTAPIPEQPVIQSGVIPAEEVPVVEPVVQVEDPMMSPAANPEPVIPVAPEPMAVNDFSKIVQMLRDCANQIEKNGHAVNMEEIDLGSQYSVTITINK
ncbi:MAG: ParB/RepB/Spo0J family partition protein [Bacilli bacterium]|nr:ParB/RepB/Spo0J family partition protein [Bacilli bacterium]